MSEMTKIIGILICVLAILMGVGAYTLFVPQTGSQGVPASATSSPTASDISTSTASSSPTSSLQAIQPINYLQQGTAPVPDTATAPPLLSSGMGTTTVNMATPLNDILIAETASEYASRYNARYIEWPYPGDIPFKMVHLVLPNLYVPIFPGYSNAQFLESADGVRHIVIHLHHLQNVSTLPDVSITVQSPVESDETDHPLTLIDSSLGGGVFSAVQNGQEVLVEVVYTAAPSVPQGALAEARQALFANIANMEIIW